MKQQRTSETHPISLDPLPSALFPGALYITFAPGKIQKNAMTGTWNRNIKTDLERIKNHYKIDALVCLIQKQQMQELKIPNLLDQCKNIGILTQWYPVVDNDVPADEAKYKQIVRKVVDQWLRAGKNVVVHCKGGLGRAGTFAASCLIYNKIQANQAIKIVRSSRKNTVNNLCQQKWLQNLKF